MIDSAGAELTIFAAPKPSRGLIGTIQDNALASWSRLRPRPQIVLIGDEEGIADAAERFDAVHIPSVERNALGTPLLNSIFARAEGVAEADMLCFINADILLFEDFTTALALTRRLGRFLLAGRGSRLEVHETIDPAPAALARVWTQGRLTSDLRSTASAEYFVFPKGLFRAIPRFALGRPGYDLWLLWRARTMQVPVVDATPSVVAVHQEHDYAHVPGGGDARHHGPEATSNRELRGGRFNLDSLRDARYVLRDGRLRRNPLSVARVHHRAWVAKLWLSEKLGRG